MKELNYLVKFFLKYKFRFILGIFFIFLSNIFGLYPPIFIGNSFDLIIEKFNSDEVISNSDKKEIVHNLLKYSLFVFLFAVGKGFFMFLMRQTIIVMSRLIEFDIKNEIYKHYQSLNVDFYKKNRTGDIMNRVSEDVSKVRMFIGPAILYSSNLIISISLIIPVMYKINPKLTFYILSPLPILVFTIYKVSNLMNKRSEVVQRQLSVISNISQESFSGIKIIKSFNNENFIKNKFQEQSNIYMEKNLSLVRVNALFFPLMILLIGTSSILTIYIGGIETINGNISIGNIATFLIFVNMLTWPVASLGWVTAIVQRAAASQKRINEFLYEKSFLKNSEKNYEFEFKKIKFEDVSYEYNETKIKAIKNINFELKKGNILGIIGKVGSGKSTLVDLIPRIIEPSKGHIFINNHDIKSINLNSLRNDIGYVTQDSFLFSDTIYNNITFGIDKIDQKKFNTVTKLTNVENFVKKFKYGYETLIGERGVTLSGGQKQRISIARAMIKNPKILILDDCFSSVDSKTEKTILKNIIKHKKNQSIIIISQRTATLKYSDNIIVLENGKIVENGKHDLLITKNKFYSNIHKSQTIS
ncbi:MAG: ABC transporter ATP-binding protein [Flavobacteriales bacterium TMED288]|nr:ABC transporter [Flavobacteriales bacterium]RPG53364.1 MAG: ABC transporter ATP-binding protein [Flavobacteriales bacterium TMED288]|tara:strand:- start:443 stop:2200 length:1758 start_codon:yes stop_codon:yes gene_type:complete